MEWLLRCLKGITNVGFISDRKVGASSSVISYVNSDYVDDLDNKKSLTCYVFILFEYTISWKSTLRPTITLSTTEAEYMVITEAMKKVIWLRSFVGNFGLHQEETIIFCDSQSAIQLTKNHMYHERKK